MATAGDIITRLNEKLNDVAGVRWPQAEHFRAINDAQNAILEALPSLFEVYDTFTPVAGSAQSAPADCYLLFDVLYNLDNAGNPVGSITRIERQVLDRQRPGWVAMAAKAVSAHWMQDDRERKKFFVVPPQPQTGRGKYYIRYARRPTAVTSIANTLSVPDEAVNAVYNFCMHRALEKDEKFAGSPTAAAYMEKFAAFLTARTAAEDQADASRSAREET